MLFKVFNNTTKTKPNILSETEDVVIAEWSDVEIYNSFYTSDTREVRLNGTYFIIQPHLQYYHFMVDALAVFLYLKDMYPEIKPLVLVKTDNEEYSNGFMYKDFLDFLGIKDYYWIDDKNNSKKNFNLFKLEKAIYLYRKPFDIFRVEEIIKNFRSKVYDEKPIDQNKKIYISRRDSDSRPMINEEALEDYLSSMGFTVVTLTGMSVMDQKTLFEDAKVVIGRSGSSFVNMFFMHKDTLVVDINTDPEYPDSEYHHIAKFLNLNYMNILFLSNDANQVLTKLKDFATIIE